MKYQDILIIGCGKMGGYWSNSFYDQGGNIVGIVDPDSDVDRIAQNLETDRYNRIDNFLDEDKSADIWCIATPTEHHGKYISAAIEQNVPRLLVEKPSTTSPEKTNSLIQKSSDTEIFVDYIELEHPVVKAIFDDLQRTAFSLTQAVHWRGKTPSNFHPYTRNDLVHDVSELFGLYEQLLQDESELRIRDVSDMYTWKERTDRFEDNPQTQTYDIRCTAHLSGEYDEQILLKGGFNESEDRRYFLWVDETRQKAYFANTVTRDHLTPFAAKISGKSNISYLVHKCIEGSLRNDSEFESVLDKVDANILARSSDEKQTDIIARKLMNGDSGPASLEQAYKIEKLIKQIYVEYGNVSVYD